MIPLPSPRSSPRPGPAPSAVVPVDPAPAPWRVIKLGGTTVADAGAVAGAATYLARLVASHRVAVVVSALPGVTDALVRWTDPLGSESADHRPPEPDSPRAEVEALGQRYLGHLATLVPSPPASRETVEGAIRADVAALWGLLRSRRRALENRRGAGGAGDLRALILSMGERLSARVVQAAVRHHLGSVLHRDRIRRVDPGRVLVAEGPDDDADPELAASRRRARSFEVGCGPGGGAARVWVVPGFFAGDARGRLRLLGRGGSDTSATLLGAALGADRIEIWTDVDGIHTADPRRDPAARRLPRLDFDQAERMARGGARILQSRSVAPAWTVGVPIWVRDGSRPHLAGTWIGGEPEVSP